MKAYNFLAKDPICRALAMLESSKYVSMIQQIVANGIKSENGNISSINSNTKIMLLSANRARKVYAAIGAHSKSKTSPKTGINSETEPVRSIAIQIISLIIRSGLDFTETILGGILLFLT